MTTPDHLIIVCGHGIWLGGPQNGWDESEWLIEAYKRGETPTFIEHIKAGVRALSEDERAVLVFSGAPTRPETPLSEARSYAALAAANNYFGHFKSSSSERILLEERALDSYHNILFSLLVFWQHVQLQSNDRREDRREERREWPTRLTIVSHAFKRPRLVDAHCAAIGFPLARVRFLGIDPPALAAFAGNAGDIAAAVAAAASNSTSSSNTSSSDEDTNGVTAVPPSAMADVQAVVGQWALDPHGVGPELAGKRRRRNCWGVDQRLFRDAGERARSRVGVVVVSSEGEDGVWEALDPEAERPWGGV